MLQCCLIDCSAFFYFLVLYCIYKKIFLYWIPLSSDLMPLIHTLNNVVCSQILSFTNQMLFYVYSFYISFVKIASFNLYHKNTSIFLPFLSIAQGIVIIIGLVNSSV